jgi:hypothetical protein
MWIGPLRSMQTNSKGADALVLELGKGLAFIFPARQGSQTGSGFEFEFNFMPVTMPVECNFLT